MSELLKMILTGIRTTMGKKEKKNGVPIPDLSIYRVTYQDVPPLFAMTSNNSRVLRPNRAPNAIASAADAI